MAIITIVFDGRRRLIGRPESYEDLLHKVRHDFNLGDCELTVYLSNDHGKDDEIELDATAYEEAVLDGIILRCEVVPPLQSSRKIQIYIKTCQYLLS